MSLGKEFNDRVLLLVAHFWLVDVHEIELLLERVEVFMQSL